MTRAILIHLLVVCLVGSLSLVGGAETLAPNIANAWPQFRGPNGSGRAATDRQLPPAIGPHTNVIWKVALAPGHSSPVVGGGRIFLTAERDNKLFTVAVDAGTGSVVWKREAPYEALEEIHRIGSHAQPSCVTDGGRVVSFFGSYGLLCYDMNGGLLWKRRLGPFNNTFGVGSSPIIVDDVVVLCQDHDTDSFLMAIDKWTGNELWNTDRSEFPRNYCTPVISEAGGAKQIVVAATLRMVGYDFRSGKERWTVHGMSRAVCMTPVIGEDGTIFAAGWAGGGDESNRISVPPFDSVIGERDRNQNGTIERDELDKDGPIERRYVQVDRDKSQSITRAEYEYYRGLFDTARNVVVAVTPGGQGDVTQSHVQWSFRKFVPFCASPLYVDGHVFTIKDGGILTAIEAKSGNPVKTGRLLGRGNYYASPVTGDGKIFYVSESGESAVTDTKGDWSIVSTSEFGEDVYATPAIVSGRIYLRTRGQLYCFGLRGNSE